MHWAGCVHRARFRHSEFREMSSRSRPIRLTLTFRQRILVVLIALGAVPTAVAILGWYSSSSP